MTTISALPFMEEEEEVEPMLREQDFFFLFFFWAATSRTELRTRTPLLSNHLFFRFNIWSPDLTTLRTIFLKTAKQGE